MQHITVGFIHTYKKFYQLLEHTKYIKRVVLLVNMILAWDMSKN